ncbi:MAG: DtxR family transcriptional regulator [Thermotogae bacterium]|nr:DtxR family transcriptional regulator [Thermotogota bacterium]RKX51659.1 MAG: hypothetical protein DRP30_07610 [Thermotoga sp.]
MSVLSESLENCLVTIYEKEAMGKPVRVKDISKKLGIRHSSVIETLKKLEEIDYVNYGKRKYIFLTKKGLEEAEKIYMRRLTIRRLFVEYFNFSELEAEELACRLEHVNSKKLFTILTCIYEFFKKNGDIYIQFLRFTEEYKYGGKDKMITTLHKLQPGSKAKVIEIKGSVDLKQRLLIMGITPGVELVVKGIAPLGDPLDITVKGYDLSIRKSEAEKIVVERIDEK